MRKRVRILFVNCPKLAVDPAAFLLLAQNKYQSIVQFEVQHFWMCGMRLFGPAALGQPLRAAVLDQMWRFGFYSRRKSAQLDLKVATCFQQEIKTTEWYECVKYVVGCYDKWFTSSNYNQFDWAGCSTIVVTETPIEGNYISYCDRGFGLISLASWKEFFGPGSALEYLLTSVQRLSLRLVYGDSIGSHFSTRGCLWDFHAYQRDSRISGYLGILCDTCKEGLRRSEEQPDMAQVERLIGNDWIGDLDDPTSVSATIAKNYGYQLNRPTGLHPGILASISDGMRSEIGKFIFDILKWVIILLATLLIAAKFPGLFKQLKDVKSVIGGDQQSPAQLLCATESRSSTGRIYTLPTAIQVEGPYCLAHSLPTPCRVMHGYPPLIEAAMKKAQIVTSPKQAYSLAEPNSRQLVETRATQATSNRDARPLDSDGIVVSISRTNQAPVQEDDLGEACGDSPPIWTIQAKPDVGGVSNAIGETYGWSIQMERQ